MSEQAAPVDLAAIKARLTAAEPVYDDRGNFLRLADSPCGEHRTVGEHRAWCCSCSEWCYASDGCGGCQPDADVDDLRALVAEVERLRSENQRLREARDRSTSAARLFDADATTAEAERDALQRQVDGLKDRLLACSVVMTHGNGYRADAIPKASLLDVFALAAGTPADTEEATT